MSTNIPRAYESDEAERRRAAFVAGPLTDCARSLFETHPQLRSVAFCVAQFWCDEALDAVHFALVPSELDMPNLGEDAEFNGERDLVNLPSFTDPISWEETRIDGDDDNGENIPLFAAFCIEGCDQEMPENECFTPYAVLRRGANDTPTVEIVGTMRRPWLDGVRPLMEVDDDGNVDDGLERFEQIYGEFEQDGENMDAPPPATKKGIFGRLLGRDR